MTARGRGAALLCAALWIAGPAAAFDDVTGVYVGKGNCGNTTASGSGRENVDVTLFVDDAGGETAYAYLNNSGLFFHLAAVGADGQSEGRLAGPDCGYSIAAGGWVLQLDLKAKPGAVKGTARGQIVQIDFSGAHAVTACEISVRRVARTLDTPITGCP